MHTFSHQKNSGFAASVWCRQNLQGGSSEYLPFIAAISILVGSPAVLAAEYGQIVNSNTTYTGDTIVKDEQGLSDEGVIEINESGVYTTFRGNVSVISGNPSSTQNYSHGVKVWNNYNDSKIRLETVEATDLITIDCYNYASSGVFVQSGDNETDGGVYIDTTSSTADHGLVINLHNPTPDSDNFHESAGLYAAGGTIDVKGNTVINTSPGRSYGLWAFAKINITGNTEVNTSGLGSYGVRGNGEAVVTMNGDFKVTTTGGNSSGTNSVFGSSGLRMQESSQLTITGKTTIDTSGVAAAGLYGMGDSTMNLGEVEITTTGDTATQLFTTSAAWGIYAQDTARITTGTTVVTTKGDKAYGVYSAGGTISITGDATVTTTHSSAATGIYASSGNIATKNTTVSTSGSGAHGIHADNGTVSIKGNIDIVTNAGNISTYGIYTSGGNGKVLFNGDTYKIRVGEGNKAIYAANGLVEGTGKFDFDYDAGIYANNGTVTLGMRDTAFNGFTAFDSASSTGYINLTLGDASTWHLSRSSQLSTIDVSYGSQLIFDITSALNFTSITTSTVWMDTGAIVTVNLEAGYIPLIGAAFQLINATSDYFIESGIDFRLADLGEGLSWDISTFATDGTIRVIPEPATATLGFLSLAGLMIRRRRS